jgi:N-methylhydantoinase B
MSGPESSESTVHPVAFEVIRSRLLAITEEMRIALQSVSGSPTVTEASDFFTGLFLPDGSFASMGFQVSFQAPVVGNLIRAVYARPTLLPRDGDMFCGNDPFVGALHQNDIQLAGPIYADGKIFAWAGVEAHVTDIGGMDFASWSPNARDARQEGLRIPCVRLVEAGRMREDILEMILTATRLPAQLNLDFRAFVATINVARERVAELVTRYGASTLSAVMQKMIEVSHRRVAERLLELPDGEFRAVDFLEHDGEANRLYKVDLRMIKRGARLSFDFSGSSRQAPGFINATRSGLEGGVTGALLPMLAYDIPWNQGVLQTAEIIAPDGLICTAQFPAPVGAATVETIWVVSNVCSQALNRLLSCAPQYRGRAQAVSDGTMATFNLGGRNQYGEPFGLHLMDPLAGGYAAFAGKDGYEAGGPINSPAPAIADVERNELAAPLFYLYRRLARDTGGAGRYRGGASAEVALTLAGIDEADALIMTHGAEVPNACGLFGGYPGATVIQKWANGAAKNGVYSAEPNWIQFGPKPGLQKMRIGDVFAASWQGGGGWGDPLDRDPVAVHRDCLSDMVSRQAAADIYGVIVKDTELDAEATRTLRASLRAERIGGRAKRADCPPDATTIGDIGPALRLVRVGRELHVVSRSGATLARGSTRWRAGAVRAPFAPSRTLRLHEGLEMSSFYCPVSGELLAVDVHEKGTIPPDDIILELASVESAASFIPRIESET